MQGTRKFFHDLSVDWFHWSIGFKFERPRHTKHNFDLWIFKLRFLCFGWAIHRRNTERVAKTQPIDAAAPR